MLWLDATDPNNFDKGEALGDLGPPASANGIGIWADKSGHDHHARPRPISKKPKWKSNGFNQLPGVDFTSSMMAIDKSAESFDAWNELTLFAVLNMTMYFSLLFLVKQITPDGCPMTKICHGLYLLIEQMVITTFGGRRS